MKTKGHKLTLITEKTLNRCLRSISDVQNETYEEYGKEHVYEKYIEQKQSQPNVDKEERKIEEYKNESNEKVYEEYDEDYDEYVSRYADYSNEVLSKRDIIIQFLTEKKWLILSFGSWLSISGFVLGLVVHFTSRTGIFCYERDVLKNIYGFNNYKFY